MAKLQEKKPEPAEGEEAEGEAAGEEPAVPVDEELEKALKELHFEGGRRYNGLKVEGCEESMRWLASLLSVFVSNRWASHTTIQLLPAYALLNNYIDFTFIFHVITVFELCLII